MKWENKLRVYFLFRERGKRVSCSSTEAEYRALATIAAKLAWLRLLFKELHIFLSHVPVLWCDNVFSIALSANPVFHSRSKHIEVDLHYVSEKVLRKDQCLKFVSSKGNLADVFMKPLTAPLFLLQWCKLLVESSPTRLRGDVEAKKKSQSGAKKKKVLDDVIRLKQQSLVS